MYTNTGLIIVFTFNHILGPNNDGCSMMKNTRFKQESNSNSLDSLYLKGKVLPTKPSKYPPIFLKLKKTFL